MNKVDKLISSLSSPAFKKRRNAIRKMGKIGDSIFIEHLILAFGGDDSWGIRAEAAKALGMYADDRLIEPLITGTQDESRFVRAESITALGRYNDEYLIEHLIKGTQDKSELVRRVSVVELRKYEDYKATIAVVKLLQDKDELVVGLALIALHSMKKIEESIEPLLFLYSNENMKPEDRTTAGWILADFSDERIIAYATRFKSHRKRFMRKSAKELLQRLSFKHSL